MWRGCFRVRFAQALVFVTGASFAHVAQTQELVFSMQATDLCLELSDAGTGADYCIGLSADACDRQSDADGAYEKCVSAEGHEWDLRMQKAHKLLLSQSGGRGQLLKAAQQSWLKYRDDHCAFVAELWAETNAGSINRTRCIMVENGRRRLQLWASLPD